VFAGEAEGARAHRSSESLRQAATAALVLLATKADGVDGKRGPADGGMREALPAPDEDVDAETSLDQLVPKSIAAKDRANALVVFADHLRRAASSALATSTERARALLDAMGAHEAAFEPFLTASDDGPELATARAKVKEIAAALE